MNMISYIFNNTSRLSKFIINKNIFDYVIRYSHTHSKNIYTELNLLYLKNQKPKEIKLDQKINKIVNEKLEKVNIDFKSTTLTNFPKLDNNYIDK